MRILAKRARLAVLTAVVIPALIRIDAAAQTISLPPVVGAQATLYETLTQRRSVRDYTSDSLSLPEIAQLLWAAQGVTAADGRRTAPSAGATYPLEVYVAVQRAAGLAPGVYHYRPGTGEADHDLELLRAGDPLPALALACPQSCVRESAAAIIIASVTARTAGRYRERAQRYVTLEAGHAAQNILLMAAALSLSATPVGAFDDGALQAVYDTEAEPLYVISVGRPLAME